MSKNAEHTGNDQLVDRFQNGDRDALKALIRNFQPKMKRIIQFHTKAGEPVEDIAQECWYSIVEKLDQLELKISFEAWATVIARRKAIDWIRKQQRFHRQNRELNEEYTDGATDEAWASDQMQTKLEKVEAAIQDLQATQKIVLTMFYLENLSLKEISKVLGIPEGTVKSRLYHARENLKNSI